MTQAVPALARVLSRARDIAIICAMLCTGTAAMAQGASAPGIVGAGEISASGSPAIEAFGQSIGDLLAAAIMALQATDPRFRDCPALAVDPAALGSGAAEPKLLIDGTLTDAGGTVAWKVTLRDRASGAVLAASEGSLPAADIATLAERLARELLEAACPAPGGGPTGWTASGGGPQIKITGHVDRIDAPFQLSGEFPGGTAVFDYVPADAAGGAVTYTISGSGVTGSGAGTFTMEPQAGGAVQIEQTTNGCVDGIAGSCRENHDSITLTPDAS